jgi:glycosyltransferase involved in cell wall biosynthesis
MTARPRPRHEDASPMRIAQIATMATSVCRDRSDSIEYLVWLLSRELTALGHDVTVFACASSKPCGELVATLPGPCGASGSLGHWQVCEWINLCLAVEQADRFDVLHSHAYLWGLPLTRLARSPMVHTLHVSPYEDEARLWSLFPDACVTAVSDYQWRAFPELKPAARIYHGVDPEQFTFQSRPGDYVCFLGRFIPGKGPLQAIAIAQALGLRLLLAGPCNDYFRETIQPLVDGRSVEYAGYISGAARTQLLGGARALLYPLEAPEPFGLVMVEAMMCGTPVAATAIGAVPEVVDDGVTGFTAPDADSLIGLMPHVLVLDRRQVRQRAEHRFSAEGMARQYAELYAQVASR